MSTTNHVFERRRRACHYCGTVVTFTWSITDAAGQLVGWACDTCKPAAEAGAQAKPTTCACPYKGRVHQHYSWCPRNAGMARALRAERRRATLVAEAPVDNSVSSGLARSQGAAIVRPMNTTTRTRRPRSLPDYAGIVQHQRSRITGHLVSIYDGEPAGMDTFSGRWQTVCEEHATVISHETLATARHYALHPDDWCEPCRDEIAAKAAAPEAAR